MKPNSIIKLENLLGVIFSENNNSHFRYSTVNNDIHEISIDITSLSVNYVEKNRIEIKDNNHSFKTNLYLKKPFSLIFNNKKDFFNIISGIIELKKLSISCGGLNFLESLDFIQKLTKLESLTCRGCCLDDITYIKYNKKIAYLNLARNNIYEISHLSNLESLESLNLYDNNIRDISPIKDLITLKYLNLDDNYIEDISSLSNLENLLELRINNNNIKKIELNEILNWKNLSQLCTFGNPISNIPIEIIDDPLNSLPGICSFLHDEINGGSKNYNEVKVLILGNGYVGKSQIAHRLADLPYNPKYDSTQKIDLFNTNLVDENSGNSINLNIWDFGGQDIYHVTHRVFMETRALFIIVWDHISEFKSYHSWNGNDYENFSLNYWIEYINYHSPGSPILIVQNKIDDLEDCDIKIIPAIKSEIKEKFGYKIDFVEVCCRPIDEHTKNKSLKNDGINILKNKILNIFNNNFSNRDIGLGYNFSDPRLVAFIRSLNTPWPNSWIEVVKDIRNKQKNKIQKITKREFYDICTKIEINNSFKISNHDDLLKFLCNASIVYHNESYFQDTVILDQEWFIEEIYKLFDRTQQYSKQLSGLIDDSQIALLTPTLIKDVWPDKSNEEISLYLNHLIKAEIILNLGNIGKQDFIEIENDSFFVPAYLPSTTPSLEIYKSVHKITNEKILEFGFIPPVLIKKLMINYMSYTKSGRIADKWQKGLVIADKSQICIVSVDYVRPKILIEYKDNSKDLAEKIEQEIEIINSNHSVKIQGVEEVLVYEYNGSIPKGLKSLELDNQDALNQLVQDKWEEMKNYFHYLSKDEIIQKITELIYQNNNSDLILEMNSIQVVSSSKDVQIDALIEIINKIIDIKSNSMYPDDPKTKYAFFYRVWADIPVPFRWVISIILLTGLPLLAYKGYIYFKSDLGVTNNHSYLDLMGKINYNGNELGKDIINKISILNFPEFGHQNMKYNSNGDFIFRDIPATMKNVKFEITLKTGAILTTEAFVVRKSPNGNMLTVDNIWIENKSEYEKRIKNQNSNPKPKAETVINNNSIIILQTNVNGDNVIDSTSIKIEK